MLGRGSKTTINRHLKHWREGEKVKTPSYHALRRDMLKMVQEMTWRLTGDKNNIKD